MMPPPARQVSFGDEYMPKFNWRSLDDTYYDHVEQAEMTGIAWECLRRDPDFRSDSGPGLPLRSVSPEFRHRWGLVFRG